MIVNDQPEYEVDDYGGWIIWKMRLHGVRIRMV